MGLFWGTKSEPPGHMVAVVVRCLKKKYRYKEMVREEAEEGGTGRVYGCGHEIGREVNVEELSTTARRFIIWRESDDHHHHHHQRPLT